jgi:hypothetical protein
MPAQSPNIHVILEAEVDEKTEQTAIGNDEYQIVLVDGNIFNCNHHYERENPNPRSHMWTSDIIRQSEVPDPVSDVFRPQLSASGANFSGGEDQPSTPEVLNTRVIVWFRDDGTTYRFEKGRSDYIEIEKSGTEITPKDVPKEVLSEVEPMFGNNFEYLYNVIYRDNQSN